MLKLIIKVLPVLHLLVLVVHHIEEILRVHFAVSSSRFSEHLLQLFVLRLQLSDEFILRTLIDDGLVLDLLGTVCVTQC